MVCEVLKSQEGRVIEITSLTMRKPRTNTRKVASKPTKLLHTTLYNDVQQQVKDIQYQFICNWQILRGFKPFKMALSDSVQKILGDDVLACLISTALHLFASLLYKSINSNTTVFFELQCVILWPKHQFRYQQLPIFIGLWCISLRKHCTFPPVVSCV